MASAGDRGIRLEIELEMAVPVLLAQKRGCGAADRRLGGIDSRDAGGPQIGLGIESSEHQGGISFLSGRVPRRSVSTRDIER